MFEPKLYKISLDSEHEKVVTRFKWMFWLVKTIETIKEENEKLETSISLLAFDHNQTKKRRL